MGDTEAYLHRALGQWLSRKHVSFRYPEMLEAKTAGLSERIREDVAVFPGSRLNFNLIGDVVLGFADDGRIRLDGVGAGKGCAYHRTEDGLRVFGFRGLLELPYDVPLRLDFYMSSGHITGNLAHPGVLRIHRSRVGLEINAPLDVEWFEVDAKGRFDGFSETGGDPLRIELFDSLYRFSRGEDAAAIAWSKDPSYWRRT